MNRNCEHGNQEWCTGKKVNGVCPRKIGDPAEVHTLVTPFKSPTKKHNLV